MTDKQRAEFDHGPYRSEHDSIGERAVPRDVYYGVQSLRAVENFPITGLTMHPEIINSIAEIKKASAITNCETGILEKKVADAIVRAITIQEGLLDEETLNKILDPYAMTEPGIPAKELLE